MPHYTSFCFTRKDASFISSTYFSMQSPSTANGLLKLPPDIRNEVYRYLLLRTSAINMCTDGRQDKTSHPSEILRTCHLIYEEAATIYYGEHTFIYQTGRTRYYPMRRWGLPLASISPRICSMMNKIKLVFDERCNSLNNVKALLRAFGGSDVSRDECQITVKGYGKWCHLWDLIEVENLTGFNFLELRINVEEMRTDTDSWWCRVLTTRLEKARGPRVLYVVNNYLCLRFRPRMFTSTSRLSQASPLSSALSLANDHHPEANFLTLPSEIRAHIYHHVFHGPNTINISDGMAIGLPNNYLAVIQACRKIHEEASTLLYGDTRFIFDIRFPSPIPFPVTPRLGRLMNHVSVVGM